MGYPSVPNSFASGTNLDPSQVNNNFVSLIQGLTDGQKDHNINSLTVGTNLNTQGDAFIGGSGSVIQYARPPHSFYTAPTNCMVWKDAATITIQAGDYFISNAVYNLAANLDWTWTSAAQNLGLDTGSEAVSTWYYLYAVVSGGSFAIIASATEPTATLDTAITGYTATTYLGPFYNDSSGDIVKTTKSKGMFIYDNFGPGWLGPPGGGPDVELLDMSTAVPPTANYVYAFCTGDGSAYSSITNSGAPLFAQINQYLLVTNKDDSGGAYTKETYFEGYIVGQGIYVPFTNFKVKVIGYGDQWLR